MNTNLAVWTFLGKRNLWFSLVGGLVIGLPLLYACWLYGTDTGLAKRQADEKKQRETLPENGESKNKYGYFCPYLAVQRNGSRYYLPEFAVGEISDKPVRYYCTEQQAKDAGYEPAE